VLMPLMVLTIYSGFSRIDPAVLRAGRSAGAGPVAVFWRVFFPLSLPAVGAGGLLVFVATLGFFITPTLLGGTGDQMFAMHITQQSEFIESQGFLQALAVVLLVIASLVVGLAMRFLGLEFIWGGQKPGDGASPEHASPRAFGGIKALLADAIGWRVLRLLGKLPGAFSGVTVTTLGGFVVLALTLPIVVVIVISFSRASFLTFPPPGFSLRWYVRFFSNPDWMTAFGTSVLVAVLSSALSVLIGAAAAMAIVRADFKGKSLVMTALVSPMIVPPVVLGLSLYGYMLHLHLVGTIWGVAMAHSVAGLPLVVVIVSSALQAVDQRQELAASVHGASPWRVFLHVTLPGMAPGLAAAAFFAFLQSFDELVLSLFLAGSSLTLLPLRLWADINYQLNPVLAVVSTIEVVLVIVGISFARKTLAGRAQS
jgi:putative spermidine/putrescine transport system permease protein